jgi:hypothetical protein
MSDCINITVTPPHKERMLLPYHVNIELTMESKNGGAQVVSKTTTGKVAKCRQCKMSMWKTSTGKNVEIRKKAKLNCDQITFMID